MAFNKLLPKQPDPYITKAADQELAKFGHLNKVVGYTNSLQTQILSLLGNPIKYNLTATTDPTPDDGLLRGYSTDSIWYNTVTQTFWACLDPKFSPNPPGAIWSDQVVGGTGLLNNMTATTMPTGADDSGDGYSINSGWYNTVTGLLYFAQAVDPPGSAVWNQVPSSGVQTIDIPWANLMTLMTNSTLKPNVLYHVTNAVDTSTVLSQAWILALSTSQLAMTGFSLINTAAITNRLCEIGFRYSSAVGSRIAWVHDSLDNYVAVSDIHNNITIARWLSAFSATTTQVKVYGANLGNPFSGTIGNGSEFRYRATLTMRNSSTFQGTAGALSTLTIGTSSSTSATYANVGDNAVLTQNGGSTTYLDVAPGKTLTVSSLTISNFSTRGNSNVQSVGGAAVAGVVTALVDTGTLIVLDGSTSITVTMPTGLIDGQRMTIVFRAAQAATTWAGASVTAAFFPASSVAPYRIQAVWDATNTIWT